MATIRVKGDALLIETIARYIPNSENLQDQFVNSNCPELTIDDAMQVVEAWKLNEDRKQQNRNKAWFDQHPWLK